MPTIVNNDNLANSDANPIDIERLMQLYGQEGITEVLESFLVEASNLIEDSRKCLDERNDKGLASNTHQLKGLAAVMAADRLSKEAFSLEQAAKIVSWKFAMDARANLEIEYVRVTNCIKRFLANKTD